MEFAAISILNSDNMYFCDPVIPEELQLSLLTDYMSFRVARVDKENSLADRYLADYKNGIATEKPLWEKRFYGSRNLDDADYLFNDNSVQMLTPEIGRIRGAV
jgi:hypothetical protein